MNDYLNRDLRAARDALTSEILCRREKLWEIFSWTSSLLVAIIVGEAAVSASSALSLTFWPMGLALLSTILVLVGYSWSWIGENLRILSRALDEIETIDGDLGVPMIRPRAPFIGYRLTITLLALIAAGGLLFTVE